jgi:hypothetical protein
MKGEGKEVPKRLMQEPKRKPKACLYPPSLHMHMHTLWHLSIFSGSHSESP